MRELETVVPSLPDRGELQSIFFGGGTPSLMPASWVQRLIETARGFGPTANSLEITLEANPTSAEIHRFEAFAQAGVNRLSVGIQGLDPHALSFLGREHTVSQARQALQWAKDIFPRFSFDLIYGLPHQTPAHWRHTLEAALEATTPSHLSCYQLTYEPGTAFYPRFLRGELAYPPEEVAVALYEQTTTTLGQAGLEAYEISNYARPGQACRHNLLYWRYDDYIGIGPGAHSRVHVEGRRYARHNLKAPETWLKAVTEKGHGLMADVSLSEREQFEEWLLMGLRLREGVSPSQCQEHTGHPWTFWCAPQTLDPLLAEGLLVLEGEGPNTRLRASPQGSLVLNQLIRSLLVSSAPSPPSP